MSDPASADVAMADSGKADDSGVPDASDPNYLALRAAVDAHAERVLASHDLACQPGCTACCRQDLSVTVVEADAVFTWLRAHGAPPQDGSRTVIDGHGRFDELSGGQDCSFLAAGGLCGIYPVRPIICRSHGLPLEIGGAVDCCPLSLPLQPSPTVLDLEGLNLRLALTAQLYEVGEGLGASVARVLLSEVRAAALSDGPAAWYA